MDPQNIETASLQHTCLRLDSHRDSPSVYAVATVSSMARSTKRAAAASSSQLPAKRSRRNENAGAEER